jgi:predicted nucleic acid-binding protein
VISAVVDSSVFVELFVISTTEFNTKLAARLINVIPHVPDIVDLEFHHALRGLLIGKKISTQYAEHARSLFNATSKLRFPTVELTDRVWSLRNNLGAYDACFIALAESLDVPLITCDEKQKRASGHRAQVEVFTA